ncbi:hypothetical protein ACT17C_18850, partial [Bacillus subtilis]
VVNYKSLSHEKRHLTVLLRIIGEEIDTLIEHQKDLQKRLNEIANIESEARKMSILDHAQIIEESKEPKSIIPKREIEKQKDKDSVQSVRKGRFFDLSSLTRLIKNILKESQEPITSTDLFNELQKRTKENLTKSNFQKNILRRARQLDDGIVRENGKYLYKKNG